MDLIVISDLHLSDGYNEKTQKYSRNEDFFFDDEFKRFLEYLQSIHSETHLHLIIAGDMFDFLQVDPEGIKLDNFSKEQNKASDEDPLIITGNEKQFGLGTEEKKTIWKLKEIAKGHKVFFQALADFLSNGNRLSIISGNHDIELYWPGVQNELKNQIALYHTPKEDQIKKRINFYPWFYYDEHYKTYIEHGNQYDPLNSFQYFLYPLLEPASDKLWVPFGSFFVRYFFNKLEISNPFADNIKPITKYLEWVAKNNLFEFLKNIIFYLPTMIRVFLKGGGWSKPEKNALNKENNNMVESYAEEFGLPMDRLKNIYSLMAQPLSRSKLRLLIHFSGIICFILTPITLIILFALAKSLGFSPWSALSSLSWLIVPIVKWYYSRSAKDNLLKIHQEIKAYLTDVQIIVFGHTHDPKIEISEKALRYYNIGTWTTVFSEEERIIREKKQFSFLWVRSDNDDIPHATLYRWNNNLNQPEKLILFESKTN